MTQLIKIRGKFGKGKHLLVDDDDFTRCRKIRWHMNHRHVCGKVDGKQVYIQNFILGVSMPQIVDHIDLNPLNNQKSNLRPCTIQQNNFNRGKPRNNTTGFKGVVKRVRKTKTVYEARIYVNKKFIYLGVWDTPEDAAFRYNKASKIHHGEFGRLNEVNNE